MTLDAGKQSRTYGRPRYFLFAYVTHRRCALLDDARIICAYRPKHSSILRSPRLLPRHTGVAVRIAPWW